MGKQIVTDMERLVPWLFARLGGTPRGQMFGFGLEEDGEIIAAAIYTDYHQNASISVHLVLTSPRAATREFLQFLVVFPFDVLKVRKVITCIHSTNRASIRLVTRLGLTLEATLKDVVEGADLCFYTGIRSQCKFLLGDPNDQPVLRHLQQ